MERRATGLGRERGRGRVTGSRRQSRRRGASATVAVPPMRCIRAGPLVRGRLGVLGGRSGSTCDASVSAVGPCSQRRRLGWIWRYPLVKDGVRTSILQGCHRLGARGADAAPRLAVRSSGAALWRGVVDEPLRRDGAVDKHKAAGLEWYPDMPPPDLGQPADGGACALRQGGPPWCGGAATSAAGVQMLCLPLASGAVTRIGRAPGCRSGFGRCNVKYLRDATPPTAEQPQESHCATVLARRRCPRAPTPVAVV